MMWKFLALMDRPLLFPRRQDGACEHRVGVFLAVVHADRQPRVREKYFLKSDEDTPKVKEKRLDAEAGRGRG